jgi:hypothetical protein
MAISIEVVQSYDRQRTSSATEYVSVAGSNARSMSSYRFVARNASVCDQASARAWADGRGTPPCAKRFFVTG